MPSEQRFQELRDTVDELVAGMYRTPNGPGTIRGKQIKPKTIVAEHIDVDALSAVNTKTGNLTVSGTVTIGAGGKIIDADGSFWDQTGITLVSTGSAGDVITWKNGSTARGYIYASSSAFIIEPAASTTLLLGQTAQDSSLVGDNLTLTADTGILKFQSNVNEAARIESTNLRLRLSGFFYPGTGSANQTTGYIDWNNGSSRVRITGSDVEVPNYIVYGKITTSGATGALPNPTKYMEFKDSGGTVYYIPLFTAFNAWAA